MKIIKYLLVLFSIVLFSSLINAKTINAIEMTNSLDSSIASDRSTTITQLFIDKQQKNTVGFWVKVTTVVTSKLDGKEVTSNYIKSYPVADYGEIRSALRDVRAVEERFTVSAVTWEQVCRWGALWDQAQEVVKTCHRAVAASDGHPRARDSRGIARALIGDGSGAIEDFEAFSEWTSDSGVRAERRQWIEQLGNDENPFTAEVLQRLRESEAG